MYLILYLHNFRNKRFNRLYNEEMYVYQQQMYYYQLLATCIYSRKWDSCLIRSDIQKIQSLNYYIDTSTTIIIDDSRKHNLIKK